MSLPIETDIAFSQSPDITQIPPSKIGKLDISKTTAYKKTLTFERKLQKILNEILVDIIKTQNDTTTIRFLYFRQVTDYFRAGLQNVYAIGANYTNDAHQTVPFLSDNDNAQIKKLAGYGASLFFLKVDKYFRREQDIEQSDYYYSIQDRVTKIVKETMNADRSVNLNIAPKKVNLKSLSIDKQVDNLVTSVVFMTLNIAVVQKTRQLLNLRNKDQTVAMSGIFDRFLGFQPIRDLLGASGAFTDFYQLLKKKFNFRKDNRVSDISQYIRWVTEMDDKVCFKYCQPLDGKQFDANDSNHPIPIISTHPNCRCRLFSVDSNGNLLADIDFSEWEG